VLLPIDVEKDFIEVPFVAGLRTTATELVRILLPKLPTPLSDRLVRHDDPALGQQLFHIAKIQGEAEVEPDGMSDDVLRKTKTFV
jgi:hypothetical protein